jgi:succinate dehydrogenase flavin-adding protein (antitoxin of CptAB toxin-antitoxin module)
MKELDLVLIRYLQGRWQAAEARERALFEQILDLPDPVLAAYLMGRESAPDPDLQRMVELLAAGTAADVAGTRPGAAPRTP